MNLFERCPQPPLCSIPLHSAAKAFACKECDLKILSFTYLFSNQHKQRMGTGFS
jgi:hypothetical protein